MKKKAVLLTLLVFFFIETQCKKVLVVFPMVSPSHHILGSALAKGLVNGGFDVTYVSPFNVKNPPKNNFKEIVLDGLADWFTKQMSSDEVDLYSLEKQSPLANIAILNQVGDDLGEKFFSHPAIKQLLKSNEKFDAVIIEQFMNDAMKILAHHFRAPLVLFSTVGANKWVNTLVGNPEPPSYVPDLFLSFDGQFSFFERVYNLLFGTLSQLNLNLIFYPAQNAILKKYFPNGPDLNELQQNVSLILANSHESINQPIPHVPNMIDIGGFHVSPATGLPKDLKEFMDNATEGVIYFSMGSNLIPSKMPKDKKDAILKVLGSRKEKVLWKWDQDMDNKPSNLKLSKWFPQQDILAHPNTKLFITHGGLLSTTETVYYGVPVLAFPIFGDQKLNAARVQSLGFGKSLPFSRITEEILSDTLKELLENSKYRDNAMYRSKIMHDRPIKPIDLAVYWVNYVIRYKGAKHLRVAGADLPLYKYLMIDVIAVLLGGLFAIIYLLFKLCRCGKRKTKLKQS